MNDGERTVSAIRAAEGKRFMYQSTDWKKAVKKSLAKKKPATGWPKD
jgi:hypothetical protein